MALKPMRPCNQMGCRNLTRDRYCDAHKKDEKEEVKQKHRFYKRNRQDEEEQRFYVSKAWRELRQVKLSMNPLCEWCYKEKRIKKAEVIDHIKPIKQGGERLNLHNLQSLCKSCHNKKTANER